MTNKMHLIQLATTLLLKLICGGPVQKCRQVKISNWVVSLLHITMTKILH